MEENTIFFFLRLIILILFSLFYFAIARYLYSTIWFESSTNTHTHKHAFTHMYVHTCTHTYAQSTSFVIKYLGVIHSVAIVRNVSVNVDG